MYCSNCGKKLSEDDFFCSNCGTPVLRQNLFSDTDDESNEDAFEETRLFTAEELGQFLNEQPEDNAPVADNLYQATPQGMNQYQYQAPMQQDYQDYQQDYIEEPFIAQDIANDGLKSAAKKSVDAKEMVSGALGSANAVVGKLKAHRQEAKARKLNKKQQIVTEEEMPNLISDDSPEGPISLKKIVLPVIILGVIIGLVFGLILVQPWDHGDETEVTTGVVMTVDSIE